MGTNRYGVKISYSNLPEYAKRKINSRMLNDLVSKYNNSPINKRDIDKTDNFFRFRQKEPRLFKYLITISSGEDRLIVGNLKSNGKRRIQSILIARR